jgi:Na+-translocating ferredoxin:NAD+ oxidoreductase RnfA subunit
MGQVGSHARVLTRAIINTVLFLALLLAHFLTYCYFVPVVNRINTALYFCLVFGAVCRLAHEVTYILR